MTPGPKNWPNVEFPSEIRERIYDHVFSQPDREVGGVLVGHQDSVKLTIVASIPALEAVGEVDSLTFTHDAWAKVHTVMDSAYPDMVIVGWYHSHPGHGIFLSNHDQFIHEQFFGEKWQVAVVVDPQRGEEGLFGWRGNGEERRLEEVDRFPTSRAGAGSIGVSPSRRLELTDEDEDEFQQTDPAPGPQNLGPPASSFHLTTTYLLIAVIGALVGWLGATPLGIANDDPSEPVAAPNAAQATTPVETAPPSQTPSGTSEESSPRYPGDAREVAPPPSDEPMLSDDPAKQGASGSAPAKQGTSSGELSRAQCEALLNSDDGRPGSALPAQCEDKILGGAN